MTQPGDPLILEIHRNGDQHPAQADAPVRTSVQLSMSVSARSRIAETVRTFSQREVAFDQLSELCRRVTFSLESSDIAALKKDCSLLWDLLLTPQAREALKSSQRRALCLQLDEELAFIPWELLYDGSQFLCNRFDLGRLVSTRLGAAPSAREPRPACRMLILADPVGDLPWAYKEGLDIRRRFDRDRRRVLIDFRSAGITPLSVKAALREYDIVHFCGHCEYDTRDPAKSGWVLEGGMLTTREVLAMSAGEQLPLLVFSNACFSAAEDFQKKTYSIASAFLFAGVRHYIGSALRVEDNSGLVFAREFYSLLLKGRPVGECVRRARLLLQEKAGAVPGATPSALWGSYILYGDPTHIILPFAENAPPAFFSIPARPGRRLAVAAGCALALAALLFGLSMVHPGRAFSLKRCRQLLAAGKNGEVISLCSRITRQDPGAAQAYLLESDALSRLGKLDEAIQVCFDSALKSGGRKETTARTYSRIGWLYQKKGDYSKALDFYTKGLQASRSIRDVLGESEALRRLAVWHMDQGDDNRALELLTRSVEIDSERQRIPEHRYNLACDYFDMGLVFVNKDQLEPAREFYGKSMRMFEKMDLTAELGDYYFNQGEVFLMEKQYQQALDCYMKGLAIDTQRNNIAAIPDDYAMIGELYAEMEIPDRAQRYLEQAVESASAIEARPSLAQALRDLGELMQKTGRPEKAKECLSRSRDIYCSMGSPECKELTSEIGEIRGQF